MAPIGNSRGATWQHTPTRVRPNSRRAATGQGPPASGTDGPELNTSKGPEVIAAEVTAGPTNGAVGARRRQRLHRF